MNGLLKYIWVILLVNPLTLKGTNACNAPLFTLTDSISTTSLRLNWTDFNSEVLGWEIEWGPSGFQPSGIPGSDLILSSGYVIDQLMPGTGYDVYIRALCNESEISNWNGPFKVRTAIANDTSCSLQLPLRDNNCPRLEDFHIEVQGYENMSLGEEVFIQSVDLIIEHDWPADLQLYLTAPDGNRILLSQNRGIGLDDYGNPSDTTCLETLSFSDFACISISEVGTDRLLGSFLPEEKISDLYQSGPVNGLWKLSSCDRALEDKGILKYVKINFAPVICNVPTDIFAREISNNSALIGWTPPDNCRVAIINVVFAGEAPGTNIEIFTSCQGGQFNVTGLLPETAYDIYIRSDCNSSLSAFSCPASFVTACNEVTLSTGFDDQETCVESCNTICEINDLWSNKYTDQQDWLIHSGPTVTENTGPDADISGVGNYVYLENSIDLCGQRNIAILETSCLVISDNPGPCDMSFYYHMEGENVDSLILLISTNDGEHWDTLFQKYGSQGSFWNRAFVDLSSYEGMLATMRIVGISGMNDRGDIAIDQIEFYGSKQVMDLPTFYYDIDGDGYAGQDSVISVCMSDPPQGFMREIEDCNDLNPEINPGETEIQCNLIDENCNGLQDDAASTNPIFYEIIEVSDESCPGAKDASISLSISGGNPPYQVNWNTGQSGSTINNLAEDVYRATITDAGTCTILTEFIDIDIISSPQIFIVNVESSQCDASTGSIDIEVAGGATPYLYSWNTGDTTQDLNQIPEGTYDVTVTDFNGCIVIEENIVVISSPRFNAGIQFTRDLTCYGDSNGIISVGVFNAIPPVTYQWSHGDTSSTPRGLKAGIYSVTINDSRECQEVLEAEILSPQKLESEIISIEQITCYNGSNGSIQVATEGGILPYSFLWESDVPLSFAQSAQEDISNLPVGSYQLSVSDGNGCIDTTRSITLTNPEEIGIEVDSSKAVRCILSSDGYLSVAVEGGAGDYGYFWGASDENLNYLIDITGGTYGLTVIDKFGCKKTVTDLVVEVEDSPIEIIPEVLVDNMCSYDSIGMIAAEISNGTLPFDFNWSSGKQVILNSNKDTVTLLPGGSYNVTVTDSEGCIGVSQHIKISTIPELNVADIDISLNECAGDESGSIRIEAAGGEKPYFYEWNNGMSSSEIDSLRNGDYYVTISDNNGCNLPFGPITIVELNPINLLADIGYADGGMDNGSIVLNISGGTPPYNINWDNLEDQKEDQLNLPLGSYCVTITDAKGCTVDDCFSVDRSNSTEDTYDKINIYPNPARDVIHINSSLNIEGIVLFNSQGQMVDLNNRYNKYQYTIDTRAITPGIYFLHLKSNRKAITEKIVIIN